MIRATLNWVREATRPRILVQYMGNAPPADLERRLKRLYPRARVLLVHGDVSVSAVSWGTRLRIVRIPQDDRVCQLLDQVVRSVSRAVYLGYIVLGLLLVIWLVG